MAVHARPLIAALCLATAAGCGGGDPGPTAPTPGPVTLTLDFSYVEVLEDCDGVEGDGDFHFEVIVTLPGIGPSDVVYRESPALGPGGKSKVIGRRSYLIDRTGELSVHVSFRASEVDQSLFGEVYGDERLNDAYAFVRHDFNTDTETWSNLGPQSISLGSSGCRVRLYWSAAGS